MGCEAASRIGISLLHPVPTATRRSSWRRAVEQWGGVSRNSPGLGLRGFRGDETGAQPKHYANAPKWMFSCSDFNTVGRRTESLSPQSRELGRGPWKRPKPIPPHSGIPGEGGKTPQCPLGGKRRRRRRERPFLWSWGLATPSCAHN